MEGNRLRLGIIGCGGVAHRHLVALGDLRAHGLDEIVVTAVCDANEEAARHLAHAIENALGYRPSICSDYKTLLSAGDIDAVDICLPHGLHHGVAIDAMESGVHVLCEKPLGITVRACRAMAEAADRTGRVLATVAPYRCVIGQRTAGWVLNESGLIGKPLTFFHQHFRPPRVRPAGGVPPQMTWRMDRMMSGGGMVMDSGFHYCDSMRHFFGDVERVYAEVRDLSTGIPRSLDEAREDTIFATFTFKSGVVGTWQWGLALPGETTTNVIFQCSEGSLRDTTPSNAAIFHLFWRNPTSGLVESGLATRRDGTELSLKELEERYLATLTEEERDSLFPGGSLDGFAAIIRDFAATIRGDRDKPEVDGWEGLRSLAVCEAVYESAIAGEPVRVDDVISGQRDAYQCRINEHWGL